ncbi:MAG TPA: Stp1/IreP family PP2C-type Ser/Thr phosphatase [Nitrospiria bacterium]|nr:Stp1/IreP family PP2C-type Ser/Thr phosphatase [Nitrospiria bacterium]
MKIVASGISDTGRVRSSNEDSLGFYPEIGLYVVADGMGGHAAGEVASRMAVEIIGSWLQKTIEKQGKASGKDLVQAVKEANHQIFISGSENATLQGMGTTMVALFQADEQAYVASVGDSRVYQIRTNQISQITRDHSLVNEYVERGMLTQEAAEHHPLKHVISRALGTNTEVEVDLLEVLLQEGDRFLLCSDGLSNKLSPSEILTLLNQSNGDLEKACRQMIEAANQKGGEDNITLILAACKGDTL